MTAGVGRSNGQQWRAALIGLALLGGIAAPATAQIDVSGRWHLVFFEINFQTTIERVVVLSQSGTVLAGSPPYDSGTIDPVSGVLHLDGTGSCFDFSTFQSIPVPLTLDATASADGATLSGTFSEFAQVSRSCLQFSGTVQGERVADTCGNGVLDAGEACDAGPLGDACCSEVCVPRPAGTSCPSDGGNCATHACDGAGACAHTPVPIGTVCRLAADACDQVEVCDGIATACPADGRPSAPDVDGDGMWDGCDPCVRPPLEGARLRVGRYVTGGKDFVSLRASVRLASGDSIPDASTTWKLLELRDHNGAPVLYAQVPPGAWDGSLGQGWRRRGSRWLFRAREPIVGTVARMTISSSSRDPNLLDVRITTPRATLNPAIPVEPLTLTLMLDGLGPSSRCGDARFAAPGGAPPSCLPLSSSGILSCR